MICDAQVHIWPGESVGHAPADEPFGHRAGPFGPMELLAEMDAAGVDRAILVPPSAQGESNAFALAAAARYPERFAVMGRIALADPASRAALAGWKRQRGMLGVRVSFNAPALRARLADGSIDWFWAAAEREELPVMLLVPGLVPAVGAIARRHPGLQLIIDHMGRPLGAQDAAAFADLDELLAAAQCPNVAVKVSAVPRFSSEPYPWRNLHPYLQRITAAFGPQRMLWGTDLSRMRCTYREAVTMFTEELPFLTADDLDAIMGRTATTLLRWG